MWVRESTLALEGKYQEWEGKWISHTLLHYLHRRVWVSVCQNHSREPHFARYSEINKPTNTNMSAGGRRVYKTTYYVQKCERPGLGTIISFVLCVTMMKPRSNTGQHCEPRVDTGPNSLYLKEHRAGLRQVPAWTLDLFTLTEFHTPPSPPCLKINLSYLGGKKAALSMCRVTEQWTTRLLQYFNVVNGQLCWNYILVYQLKVASSFFKCKLKCICPF